MRSPLRLAPALSLALATLAWGQPKPPAGAEAAAYVRVIGDFRAEYKRIWKLPVERRDIEIATGSGFVIAPGGLILTNHHVVSGRSEVRSVEGEPAEVTMQVTRIEAVVGAGEQRRVLPAVVVAADESLDLALLSVTTAELPYVRFGDSDAVAAGQPARVLGFPFGGRLEVARPRQPGIVPDVTVSAGRVAATRSDASGEPAYLQTDATVNPGSSGGPMLDGEGYALGVVRSKLARAQGVGFAIPINTVKDFLEAHGYLGQLPARRLRPRPAQASDWKGLRLRVPEGLDDDSRSRLRLVAGAPEEAGALRVDRIASPWPLARLEEALLRGGFDGLPLAPPAPGAPPPAAAPPSRAGHVRSGTAFGAAGALELRVEYTLLDLGGEKLLARFLAPPDQVSFNLAVIREALASLEAEPLLQSEPTQAAAVELRQATLRDPRAPPVPVPARFLVDETPGPGCPGLEPPDSLLSASPVGDFTVAFRVAFWPGDDDVRDAAARACPGGEDSERFGIGYRARSAVVRAQDGLLRFEAEAPVARWRLVEALAEAWLASAGALAR